MKTHYRGFTLEVTREKCLAGYKMLYYTAYRDSDGWEMICGFLDSEDTVRETMKDLKNTVDDYYENPKDYDDELLTGGGELR